MPAKTDEEIVREALSDWFSERQSDKDRAFSALDRLVSKSGSKVEITPQIMAEIAYKDCELLGIDPSARTPDGPFIFTAIKSVEHTIKAIEACGFKLIRVLQ
jgi:hypothetical protein